MTNRSLVLAMFAVSFAGTFYLSLFASRTKKRTKALWQEVPPTLNQLSSGNESTTHNSNVLQAIAGSSENWVGIGIDHRPMSR